MSKSLGIHPCKNPYILLYTHRCNFRSNCWYSHTNKHDHNRLCNYKYIQSRTQSQFRFPQL